MIKEASVVARERRVQRELSLRSVAAEAAAVRLLAEAIAEIRDDQRGDEREQEDRAGTIGLCRGQEAEALDAIIDALENNGAFRDRRRLIKEDAESAIAEVLSTGNSFREKNRHEDSLATTDEGSDYAQLRLSVVSAFDTPFVPIDGVKYKRIGSVSLTDNPKRSVLGSSESKADVYRERLHLLLQRTLRHPNFVKPTFDYEKRSEKKWWEVTAIQSLVGDSESKFILGVLLQLEDGAYSIEDFTGVIQIDLSMAQKSEGFYTENCIVIAEGFLRPEDSIFVVKLLGFPPLEDRTKSLKACNSSVVDYFGAGILSKKDLSYCNQCRENSLEDMFVVLSDIWLDDVETMERLETVFAGYEESEVIPSLFVLMGNFFKRSAQSNTYNFKECAVRFGELGKMINKYNRVHKESSFLIVPGMDDPGHAHVLPRPALPEFFAKEFRKHTEKAVFGTNPCRVRFYDQEMIFFRQDQLSKMKRLSLVDSSVDGCQKASSFQRLAWTILHQAHLTPLPLPACPVYWEFDHALRIFPLPHTVVIADRAAEQEVFEKSDCLCLSPGCFAIDGQFILYRPSLREGELCSLSNNNDDLQMEHSADNQSASDSGDGVVNNEMNEVATTSQDSGAEVNVPSSTNQIEAQSD